MNFAMATLGLKDMAKFLLEGREKSLASWLSQFNFAIALRDSSLRDLYKMNLLPGLSLE